MGWGGWDWPGVWNLTVFVMFGPFLDDLPRDDLASSGGLVTELGVLEGSLVLRLLEVLEVGDDVGDEGRDEDG